MRLVAVSGRQRGKVFDIEHGRYVVGRSGDSDIQIMDIAVSRRHCLLEVGPRGVVSVRDLGSANGTFVNGVPVETGRLDDGGVLKVGESELALSLAAAEAPTSAPTVIGDTGVTEFMSTLVFCGRCNESIPLADVEEGRAALVDGEYYCCRCRRKHADVASDASA